MDTSQAAVEESPFTTFVSTIAALRAPGGCPWDREQTHASIAPNMLEEAFEAVDAIESDDMAHLREELGDVLLQVVLQSQIAADEGLFTIDDVCRDINAKMVRRHPHIFGTAQAADAEDVRDLWAQVKQREREDAAKSVSPEGEIFPGGPAQTVGEGAPSDPLTAVRPAGLLDSVPKGFPALMQAQKISSKAVAAGFEWEDVDDVWVQVFSEIDELREAYAAAPKTERGKVAGGEDVKLEMGDVLFTLVNVARKMGIDAESALRAGCDKFRSRWAFIEDAAWAQGRPVEELSVEEMEAFWKEAKTFER